MGHCGAVFAFLLTWVFSLGLYAAEIHVDDDNTTGTQTGAPGYPYPSLQAAVIAAASGDSILIAAGGYAEVVTLGKALTFRGGYPGGTAAGYAAGRGGDFKSPALGPEATVISGGPQKNGVTFTRFDDNPYHGVLENLTVRGSRKGIVCDTEQSWPQPDHITLKNVVVEENGAEGDASRGAGVLLTGTHAVIENCRIANNKGGRGPGLYGEVTEELVVENCRILNNISYDDHGGGVYLCGNITLSGNVIAGNRVAHPENYGWGGGVLVHSAGTVARLIGNTIRDNSAPTYGGGVFVDEGAMAHLQHNLICHNRTESGNGAGVAVDDGEPGPSSVFIANCTIAQNNAGVPMDEYQPGGNGVFLDVRSSAEVVNTIFWGNGDDVYVRENVESRLTMTYSLSQEPMPGTGNLSTDPLFHDPGGCDFHLESLAGRYDPQTAAWVRDSRHSPAIDAGDPASSFDLEPEPNGGRVNLGAYGNTHQASKSLSPMPGDINGDGAVNLSDVLAGLNILAGEQPFAAKTADVNGDNRLGLAEIIHDMETIARMR